MAHELRTSFRGRLKNLLPFGIGRPKPKHYRDLLKVALRNRDNLGYAWKVLSRGSCDGCALGSAGLRDWTLKGTHLCTTRLELLRLNTMPELDHQQLADVSVLDGANDRDLRDLGRLGVPMIRQRGEPGFRKIHWDEAYQRIAARIRASAPERLAFFFTSRGLTNEVYYVAQKVVRSFGTNNIDNSGRLCHAPSTAALNEALGVTAATCSYSDWIGADLLVFFGANPANDQPVATKYVRAARKQGTRVVLVNPYREPGMERYWIPSRPASSVFGSRMADDWFPVHTGGDIAFLYGVLKIIFQNDWHDADFVGSHTEGYEALRRETDRVDWEQLEVASGLSRAAMGEFAELIRGANSAVFVWGTGVTQHGHGTDAVQMIINLGLTKGFVGRAKCGLMPIPGPSGVQGGVDMGASATAFPGGRNVGAAGATDMAALYGFDVPGTPGLTTTEMIDAAASGRLDLLYCVGGNFVRTLPQPDYVAEALRNVPLRVHQDVIVSRQLLIEPKNMDSAVILLPAQTRYEQEDGGIQTSAERRVVYSPEIPRVVGEARSEWRIFLELADAVDGEAAQLLGCADAAAIRQEIARVVPAYDGIQNFEKTGDSLQCGGAHLCAGWRFPTAGGKARFAAVPLPRTRRREGQFVLSTRRGRQFNSLIYADVDPLNGAARDAVLMNPEDAASLHLRSNDKVRLSSDTGVFEGRLVLAPIARGNVQVYFPEGNVLIPRGVVDAGSGVPDFNADVRIEGGRLRRRGRSSGSAADRGPL